MDDVSEVASLSLRCLPENPSWQGRVAVVPQWAMGGLPTPVPHPQPWEEFASKD